MRKFENVPSLAHGQVPGIPERLLLLLDTRGSSTRQRQTQSEKMWQILACFGFKAEFDWNPETKHKFYLHDGDLGVHGIDDTVGPAPECCNAALLWTDIQLDTILAQVRSTRPVRALLSVQLIPPVAQCAVLEDEEVRSKVAAVAHVV